MILVRYLDPNMMGREYLRDLQRLREIITAMGGVGPQCSYGGAGGVTLEISGPKVPTLRRKLERAIETEGLRVWIEDGGRESAAGASNP